MAMRPGKFDTPLRGTNYLPAHMLEVVEVASIKKWASPPEWTMDLPPIAPPAYERLGKMLEAHTDFRINQVVAYLMDKDLRQRRSDRLVKPLDKLRWRLHLLLLDWGVII